MQKAKNYCRKLTGKVYEANGYYRKGNYNESEKLLLILIDSIDNSKSIDCNYIKSDLLVANSCKECIKIVMHNIYRRLFYIKKNEGNFSEALEYLLKRKCIVENLILKDDYFHKNNIAISQSLALLKTDMGMYADAFNILKQSNKDINKITINKKEIWGHNFYLQKANILNSLGDVCVYLNLDFPKKSYLDSASVYYKQAYNILKESSNENIDSKALYKIRKINIFIQKRDYKSALFYLNRYSKLFDKLPRHKPNIYYYKSTVHRHLKSYDSSNYYSRRYIDFYKKQQVSGRNLIFIYDNLANSYSTLNINDSVLKYSNFILREYKKIEKSKNFARKHIYKLELEELEKLNSTLINKLKRDNLLWYLLVFIPLLIVFLFYLLRKRKVKSKKSKKKIDNELVSEVLDRLSEFEKTKLYLDKGFNIHTLVKYLNTNTTYLSIIINNYKSQTFKQYLSQLRIDNVIEKFHKDEKFLKYSIEAMGKEVGYSNASAFTRSFKRAKKVTPSEYIKSKIKGI